MSKEFLFPDVGEGIAEGKLVEWKVSQGDTVKEDDVLADVETDKAVVEIPSPQSGTIQELKASPGDVISVGDVLLVFGDGDEKAPKTKDHEVADDHQRDPKQGTKKVESTLTPTAPTPEKHDPPITEDESVSHQEESSSQKTRVLAAPSTRRKARELGVDISAIEGSGPNGRVLLSDLESAPNKQQKQEVSSPAKNKESQSTAKPDESSQPESQSPVKQPQESQTESQGYTGRRKLIGEHLQQTTQIPTVTEFATADVSAVIELREHLKEKASSMGVDLTYLPFFVKAVCSALRKYPQMNSHFLKEDIKVFEDIHMGIAVDTNQGLVVPVIKQAGRISVLEIANQINDLASQARKQSIAKEKLSGSTFSISSIGRSRVGFFTPLLNTPETAILGIGGFRKTPWVVDEQLEIRSVVDLSVTYDHRVVDGAYAAEFLSYLVELIEDPELLVLGGI